MGERSAADAALIATIRARAHATLVVLLIALRPLVWDGDPTQVANLAYLVLGLVALAVALIEAWCGGVTRWRWTWNGALFALIVIGLAPAALRAPLPVEGAALWGMLAAHLGIAFYLMQAIPGRERLAFAALAAGLVGEVLVATGQRLWVLPGMAEASAHGDFAAIETAGGELAERIRNGGIYGTFTLANTLAAYLILVVPAVIAAVWRRGSDPAARAIVAPIAILALIAFIGASSKGAILALAVAIGLVWMAVRRDRWRWLPLAALVLGISVIAAKPSVLHPLWPSTRVRIGYWEGAAALVAQKPLAGHGIGGFSALAPATMPLWAEPSKRAHNEVLEAAVDGGIGVAALLVLLLARLAIPRPTPALATAPSAAIDAWIPVFLCAGVLYWSMFGMLIEGNLVWWPGGGHYSGLAWAGAIGAAMALTLAALQRVPPPPAWSLALGIIALAMHSLLDFDLHSAAIWGTLIVCACLRPGDARELPIARSGRGAVPLVVATIAAAALAWSVGSGIVVANRVREAHELADRVRDAYMGSAAERERALASLARAIGEDDAQTFDAESAKRVLIAGRARAEALAPPDHELELSLLASERPGAAREPSTRRLVELMPFSSFAAATLARDHAALAAASASDVTGAAAHWRAALDWQRRAVALAPAYVPARRVLATLLEKAAGVLTDDAAALTREREQTLAEATRLEGIVDAKNIR